MDERIGRPVLITQAVSVSASVVRQARSLRQIFVGAIGLLFLTEASALNLDQFSPKEIDQLTSVLAQLDPLISHRKHDGTVNLIRWEELYEPLTPEARIFLDACRAIKAETLGSTSHLFGESDTPQDLVRLGPQTVTKNGQPSPLDEQYLPREVFDAYTRMTAAMERDLGRRLLVESGYRSPAYQLYLFLFYMPKHGYSMRQTNRFVALPGYSEHGNPARQAIDFINQDGINGEDHPEEFEALPEYQWLLQHARAFGFSLSYPRDNPHNTAFEPWHWHYEKTVHGP